MFGRTCALQVEKLGQCLCAPAGRSAWSGEEGAVNPLYEKGFGATTDEKSAWRCWWFRARLSDSTVFGAHLGMNRPRTCMIRE